MRSGRAASSPGRWASAPRELEAEEEERGRLAVRRERARVARDLHDVVAHHLAVVVVQAGAGRLEGTGAAARFAVIRDAAADALADLERLPHAAPDARPERLAAMLERARLAGLRVATGPLEPLATLGAEQRAVAHSVVQEGLTNAIKHAPGAVVHVGVERAGDTLDVGRRRRGRRRRELAGGPRRHERAPASWGSRERVRRGRRHAPRRSPRPRRLGADRAAPARAAGARDPSREGLAGASRG